MQYLIKYTIAFVLLLAAAGCVKKEAIPVIANSNASLRDLIANNFSFSMWYDAMQRSGTDSLLDNSNGYTLFAPDNGAFSRSGISIDSLHRINAADLRKLVLYHILPGKISSAGIPQTLNYGYATVSKDFLYTSTNEVDTNLYVNGIIVVKKDIASGNGFIHPLANVLTPPPATVQDMLAANPDYSVLVAGFKKFNLWDHLRDRGPMVVFAPTNEAFAAHNLDEAAINAMNVQEYRKEAFGSYILDQTFYFIPNVKMAPPAGPFILNDIFLLHQRGANGMDLRIKAVPSNYLSPEMQNRVIFYGDWVEFPVTRPGKLAANGIVHEANNLYMIPDSVSVK